MIAEELELEESGQIRLGVDGEQRSLEGLAAPVEPAPLNHEPERPAAELAEARAAFECDTCGATFDDGIDAGHHEAEHQPKRRSSKPAARTYACGCCGRKLKPDHYVYSRHTGSRYCWPGEGCQKPRGRR